MKKLLGILCAIMLVFGMVGSAGADSVGVWGDRYSLSTINNFYDGLSGHDSSILTDLTDLSEVDLLWAVQPADAYALDELDYMTDFLRDGGRIAFMGEHGTYAPGENNRINGALAYFNSDMSIINNSPDAGYHNATRDNGQILDHSLTEDVNIYNYACFAELSITVAGNAQALMLGTDHTQVMMGYENIMGGSVFLITDQNVWDNVYSYNLNDNAIMFENLLTGDTGGAAPVPEPSTILLMGTGLLGLLGYNRKRFSKKS